MSTETAGRELQCGRVIAGKYRIESVIAEGGQGTVVRATHLRLKQPVAIKFPHLPEDDMIRPVARLFREARAVFRLQGEHVARIVDVDLVEGAPFIVMEYLDGVDLKELLSRRGPLPVDEAVGLILQACDAVAEAHELGIVHRDLKPSNLFVIERPDGTPMLKVLDFGLSKTERARKWTEDAELTQPAVRLGSPRYMSPEQVRDPRAVDGRSDIWALGAILQELLTGTAVFRARGEDAVLAEILKREPAPLSLLRQGVPPEVERAVWRCLQKLREHRFATVGELAEALAGAAPSWAAVNLQRLRRQKGDSDAEANSGGSQGSGAAARTDAGLPPATPEDGPPGQRGTGPSRAALRRMVLAAAGGACVVLIAWGIAVGLRSRPEAIRADSLPSHGATGLAAGAGPSGRGPVAAGVTPAGDVQVVPFPGSAPRVDPSPTLTPSPSPSPASAERAVGASRVGAARQSPVRFPVRSRSATRLVSTRTRAAVARTAPSAEAVGAMGGGGAHEEPVSARGPSTSLGATALAGKVTPTALGRATPTAAVPPLGDPLEGRK